MSSTTLKAAAVAALPILAGATAAQACTGFSGDVFWFCPAPVEYPGPKTLTPTSRALPRVGTAAVYENWNGPGRDVQVVLGGNGTGYQKFYWER